MNLDNYDARLSKAHVMQEYNIGDMADCRDLKFCRRIVEKKYVKIAGTGFFGFFFIFPVL